jgi:crotonobetainyl-CoA:carnitine CoA-transferase CaiB-like acyl-CoA transferase
MICAGNDAQFGRLVEVLGAPELSSDGRFRTNAGRVANREALREQLESLLQSRPRIEWRDELSAAGVPSGPVQGLDEAFSLAAALELDVVDDYGGVRTVAFPAHLSDTPASTRRRPPALDEHGPELRDELSARSARPPPPA